MRNSPLGKIAMGQPEENMETLGMAIHRAAEAEKALKYFEEE